MSPNLATEHNTPLRRRVQALTAEVTRLRQEIDDHRELFAAMDEGFALLEVLLDAAGRPVDLRPIEVSHAFAAQLGARPEAVVGRTLRQLLPGIAPWWIETLSPVALSGQSARVEHSGTITGHHYDVHAWSPRPGLCAVLTRDVTEQRRAEEQRRASERRLEQNLAGMTRLQTLSTQLLRVDEMEPLLYEILAAAAELTGTDRGNLQLVDAATDKLYIVVHHGLSERYVRRFATQSCAAACEAAQRSRQRVIIQDVRREPALQGTLDLEVLEGDGIRAILSTPLITRDGRLVGMLNSHFPTPYEPTEDALRFVDLLARMAADLIERAQARDALRASEARFRELADAMPQLVWTAQPDGTVDYCNRRHREFDGLRRVGQRWEWLPMLHPDDVAATAEAWQRAIATGTTYQIEHRARRTDGSYRWYLSRAVPARDAEGRIHKWYGTTTDIHDSKVAERARRESEERFRSVLENSRDVIYRTNLHTGCYEYLSPSVKALTGYTEEELLAMPAAWTRQRIHPEDRPRVTREMDALQHHPPGKRSAVIEYRWRHRNGTYRWVSNSCTLLTDAHDRPLALVGTLHDLTKRKKIELRLQELNETLEQRVAERTRQLRALAAELVVAEERERRRLAQVLHDDLQQTLAAVAYRLEHLRMQASLVKDSDALEEPIAMLREAMETSRSLTTELSPAALFDSGGFRVALQGLGRRMEQQHGLRVVIRANAPAEAPPISDDVKILLYQSVRELLFNVVKHAHTREATVSIDHPSEDTVEVVVADSGQGFDVAQHTGALRSAGGFGLFSISERLEYVGGSVRIESAPGRGTRVALVAPLQPLPSSNGRRSGSAGPALLAVEERASDARTRILLADDHAIIRKGLLRLLEDQPDFVVLGEAEDGHAAVALAQELLPDVVLMDLAMPGMDVIEATQRITATLPGVRVIGLSMYDDPENERLMRQAGAEAYVTKGGPPEALFAAIRAGSRE